MMWFDITKEYSQVLLVTGIIFTAVFSSNNFLDQKIYAHMFTTDETGSFLAFADQLQVESELVQVNLINNNLSLAQNHANKAAALLTPSIVVEIAETNQKVADDLMTAVNNLQRVTSTSENQRQMVKQLVTDINATLGEAVNIRIEQGERESSSNFLERGIDFLRGIFGDGSKETDIKVDRNETTQPLAFADLVDSILVNYGNAYAVDFDMTNMTNMAMTGGSSSSMAMSNTADDNNSNSSNSMNMDSMDMSSSSMMMNMESKNRNYVLVDITDYQSAQALAIKAQEIFNTELKSMVPKNSSAFITNLENGLTELNDSIQSKGSPMDIMMIVHTQIHPNLLEAFNLKLR
jgi:hypothetical protein